MSVLDRIAAAIIPVASEKQRAESRARLEELAVGNLFAEDILAQHKKIEDLFAMARFASGDVAEAIILELALLLNGHSLAEEAVIYSEISINSSKAHAAIAFEEHALTKVQLTTLQKLTPGTKEWTEKLDHIESGVQQHVYQEESSWLPDVIRFASIADKQRMSVEFRDYFDRFDRA